MRDGVFYPLAVAVAAAMVALALVWPQGLGQPSPAPFGRPLAPLPRAAPVLPAHPSPTF